jgi:histidine decarboxylase
MSLKKKDKVEFENFLQLLKEKKRTFVGYPVNTTFDYSEISDFLEYPINNLTPAIMELILKSLKLKF